MFLVSFWSWLCPIHWSQVFSQEWNVLGATPAVINNFNAHKGASNIRGFTVILSRHGIIPGYGRKLNYTKLFWWQMLILLVNMSWLNGNILIMEDGLEDLQICTADVNGWIWNHLLPVLTRKCRSPIYYDTPIGAASRVGCLKNIEPWGIWCRSWSHNIHENT